MERFIQSLTFKKAGVIQATSTKFAGNMALKKSRNTDGQAQKNLDRFFKELGLVGLNAVTLLSVQASHSSNIAIVRYANNKGRVILGQKSEEVLILKKNPMESKYQKALEDAGSAHLIPEIEQGLDAAICHQPNIFLGLLHADCTPVCIYDPLTQFYGLIHAGTLGTLNGIVSKTISLMQTECGINPASLIAYIGPCIGGKNYNITYSIYWPIIKQVISADAAKTLDLKSMIFQQLIKAGLKNENIETSKFCTAENELFFSNHKAQNPDNEGRNFTIIGI